MGVQWDFRILGPLEVWRDGKLVPIPAAKQRVLLAALLVDANRVVSMEQLIGRLWGTAPPAAARTTLHNYVMRLRRTLGDDGALIATKPMGYLVNVEDGALDTHRFDAMTSRARELISEGAAQRAATLLRQALALWRGDPLSDAPSELLHSEVVTGLTDRWLAGIESRIDADLLLGRHAEVVAELHELTARYPLRERFWAQSLLALYRAGRQAEALADYRAVTSVLAEQLGVDPNPELRRLHQRILAADPTLAVNPTPVGRPAVVATVRLPVPRQLPAPPPRFTGRVAELNALDKRADQPSAVVISTIGGMGGIGKSWLALHWAHQNIDRFPDGQLYVDLRGFGGSGGPLAPAAVVGGFLDALGVAAMELPVELDAQVGLYRSLVADKRMLIVLDNARDSAQVVPLLPGTRSCTVLVTSRHRLGGLVTTHGAQPLTLDVLAEHDARALLTSRIGHDTIAAEPEAITRLLRHCAGLPLALGIVAARAATQDNLGLARLADELAEASARLDALDAGELTANLRAAFAASYHTLQQPAATAFCLLGLVPGPDVSLPAAASLLGLPSGRAAATLRELEAAYLVQRGEGRYRMHDLVRLYAAEQAGQRLTDRQRRAALDRLVDFYVHGAYSGERLLDAHRPAIELSPPAEGCQPVRHRDIAAALDWFTAEHSCLLATLALLSAEHNHVGTWRLVWSLGAFHWRRGHVLQNVATWRTALAATVELADPALQAHAHRRLGLALARAGDHSTALEHLARSTALAQQAGDVVGEAHTRQTLAWVWARRGDDERALSHAEDALELFRTTDNPVWEAEALNLVGWYHARVGHNEQAIGYCRAALRICVRHGGREGQADALDSLGYIAHNLGRPGDAVAYYRRALAVFEELGHAYEQANTLDSLASAYAAMGEAAEAAQSWWRALRMYETQRRGTEAHRVAQRLAELSWPAQAPGVWAGIARVR